MRYTKILLFVLTAWLASCAPQKPALNYVHDSNDTSGTDIEVPELTVQRNDLLSIQVYSLSTRPEVSDALYNLPCASASSGPGTGSGVSGGVGCGYLVDAKGNIEFPRVGLIHVQGLNKQEVGDLVKRKINEKDSVLTSPTVIVRFQNLKVTVMGEVKAPGVHSFPGERITILEAIGLAGDVTDYGLKDHVKVIREVNGKRQTADIDLTSKNLFGSPYYNLMQNDVVLIEPSNKKTKQQDQALVYQKISLGLSIVTAVALIYNVFQ